jgi:hypothetical protein
MRRTQSLASLAKLNRRPLIVAGGIGKVFEQMMPADDGKVGVEKFCKRPFSVA